MNKEQAATRAEERAMDIDSLIKRLPLDLKGCPTPGYAALLARHRRRKHLCALMNDLVLEQQMALALESERVITLLSGPPFCCARWWIRRADGLIQAELLLALLFLLMTSEGRKE
jgi:hypothetical protein